MFLLYIEVYTEYIKDPVTCPSTSLCLTIIAFLTPIIQLRKLGYPERVPKATGGCWDRLFHSFLEIYWLILGVSGSHLAWALIFAYIDSHASQPTLNTRSMYHPTTNRMILHKHLIMLHNRLSPFLWKQGALLSKIYSRHNVSKVCLRSNRKELQP
jgi:hypothetical protein